MTTVVARSFHYWGKPERSCRALPATERTSPDEVRYRKPIQQITTSLRRHEQLDAFVALQSLQGGQQPPGCLVRRGCGYRIVLPTRRHLDCFRAVKVRR